MLKTTTETKLVRVREAARRRGVYVRRLWAAIRSGELPAYQIGGWLRVRLSDVDRWIEGFRVTSPGAGGDQERAAGDVRSGRQEDKT